LILFWLPERRLSDGFHSAVVAGPENGLQMYGILGEYPNGFPIREKIFTFALHEF
jgi:hypothetical protein